MFQEIRPGSGFETVDFVKEKLGGLPLNDSGAETATDDVESFLFTSFLATPEDDPYCFKRYNSRAPLVVVVVVGGGGLLGALASAVATAAALVALAGRARPACVTLLALPRPALPEPVAHLALARRVRALGTLLVSPDSLGGLVALGGLARKGLALGPARARPS